MRIVITATPGFHVVYGVSEAANGPFDLAPTRRLLDGPLAKRVLAALPAPIP